MVDTTLWGYFTQQITYFGLPTSNSITAKPLPTIQYTTPTGVLALRQAAFYRYFSPTGLPLTADNRQPITGNRLLSSTYIIVKHYHSNNSEHF